MYLQLTACSLKEWYGRDYFYNLCTDAYEKTDMDHTCESTKETRYIIHIGVPIRWV